METVTDFIFLGSKVTANGDCSHEIGRKAMINIDSILKSRGTTLLTKVHIVKAMASLIAQLVKNLLAMQETLVRFLGWEDHWRRETLCTPVFWPGKFHGLYSPWGHKELDTTE